MDLGPLFAAFEDGGLRAAVEGVAWAAGALVTVLGALRLLWNQWPVSWIREQYAEDEAGRLTAAIESSSESWRAEVRTDLTAVAQRLDSLHEQGARTEHDLEQHRAESASQHEADLRRRQTRQAHQDEREQAQEVRLDALEHGQAETLGRLQTVERLAVTVARRVGAGAEAEEIVADADPDDGGS